MSASSSSPNDAAADDPHSSPAAHIAYSSGENARSQTIVTTRVFAAPREKLFHAFRDPAQLARWWGPRGFTSTFQTFEFRPGGVWRFIMHGPDGADYPNENHFVEIVTPERVVFEHRQTDHNFRTTMLFVDENGGTRVTWQMAFEAAADFAQVEDFIRAANEQSFDRLAAHFTR